MLHLEPVQLLSFLFQRCRSCLQITNAQKFSCSSRLVILYDEHPSPCPTVPVLEDGSIGRKKPLVEKAEGLTETEVVYWAVYEAVYEAETV